MAKTRLEARRRRQVRIRQTVHGTDGRPRLAVFRSSRHIYVQVVNDESNQVLTSASTVGKVNQEAFGGVKKLEQAKKIGAAIAERCKSKGIDKVVFDRGGFRYQGRVRALADAAREAGLKF